MVRSPCSGIIALFSFFDQLKLLPVVIRLLCLGLQTMYPSVQATIWGNVGKVTELLDTVLDCFIKVFSHERAFIFSVVHNSVLNLMSCVGLCTFICYVKTLVTIFVMA